MFPAEQLEAVAALSVSLLSVVCAAYLATLSLRACLRLLNPLLPRPASVVRALPALILMAAVASPAKAGDRSHMPSRRGSRSLEPPWSGSNGFSPPHLLDRTGAFHGERHSVHPGIHGRRGNRRMGARRLFERAPGPLLAEGLGAAGPLFHDGRGGSREAADDGIGVAAAMHRHPSGKRSTGAHDASRYTVKPGDKLWSIAGAVLATEDAARIARYWPRIHRANRAVIGSNPDLIHPGQVLVLPPEQPGSP
jgi:LysM domain